MTETGLRVGPPEQATCESGAGARPSLQTIPTPRVPGSDLALPDGQTVPEFRAALARVPEQFRGGLERYILDRIPPGGFLCAVLANDLRDAVQRASFGSLDALPELLTFLAYHAPCECYGSRERVRGWTEVR